MQVQLAFLSDSQSKKPRLFLNPHYYMIACSDVYRDHSIVQQVPTATTLCTFNRFIICFQTFYCWVWRDRRGIIMYDINFIVNTQVYYQVKLWENMHHSKMFYSISCEYNSGFGQMKEHTLTLTLTLQLLSKLVESHVT